MADEELYWRMKQAEARLTGLDAGFAQQVKTITQHDEAQARLETTVKSHEASITLLAGKLDKVYWALIGLSLTIAGSALAAIITLGHPT